MQGTGTSSGRAVGHPPPQRQREQRPPAPSPARPDTQISSMWSDEEFLSRFGDTIDDRIAEILGELLAEQNATRPRYRLSQILCTVSLILALAVSVLHW